MQKYRDAIINSQGRPVQGATVAVTTYPGGVAATIYADNGVTALPSNTVASDVNGAFSFYAADGRYTITLSGAGISATVISDILLEDPVNASAVNISGGTINSTPIGATTPSTGAFTTLSAVNTIQTGTNAVNGVNIVNGPSSGTAGGSAVIVQNTGTPIIAIGNKSALIGGAYDATPYIYSLGTINTNAGLSVTGALSATGVANFGTSNLAAGYVVNGASQGSNNAYFLARNETGGSGNVGYWLDLQGINSAGVYLKRSDSSLNFYNFGADRLTLDTSGNLGLGVPPSGWGSTYKSLEGTFGQGWYYNNTATLTGVTSNTYNNGTNWIYKTTNPAMRYELGGAGTHTWYTCLLYTSPSPRDA